MNKTPKNPDYSGLNIGDKVYFSFRDLRKRNPDRHGLGTIVARGMYGERRDLYILGIEIRRTRKVAKVLIEMEENGCTERFLRNPEQCFKAVEGEK